MVWNVAILGGQGIQIRLEVELVEEFAQVERTELHVHPPDPHAQRPAGSKLHARRGSPSPSIGGPRGAHIPPYGRQLDAAPHDPGRDSGQVTPGRGGTEELGDPHTNSEAERDRLSVATYEQHQPAWAALVAADTSPERPMCGYACQRKGVIGTVVRAEGTSTGQNLRIGTISKRGSPWRGSRPFTPCPMAAAGPTAAKALPGSARSFPQRRLRRPPDAKRRGVSGPSTSSTRRTVRSGVATATATIPIRRRAEFRTAPPAEWAPPPPCAIPRSSGHSHLEGDRRLESARVRRSRLGGWW